MRRGNVRFEGSRIMQTCTSCCGTGLLPGSSFTLAKVCAACCGKGEIHVYSHKVVFNVERTSFDGADENGDIISTDIHA